MIWLLAAMAAAAAAYQLLVLAAALRFLSRRETGGSDTPPVSILKPVHGLDPHFWEAIRSHAIQDYPEYEILFGVSDPSDPAIATIERLIREFPQVPMRLIVAGQKAPNPKVGVLIGLARLARYPVLLVNDSDIAVPPDYLRRVVAVLDEPGAGLVTCLYRGEGQGLASRFEALAIATEFAPGVLVAPLLGVSEFALGATMAFRAADLARAGGFESVADYLADDYQLGRRICSLGLRVVLAPVVITTYLANKGWRQAWRHQVRWARTVRFCRRGGYLGMPVTMATLWATALAAAGRPLGAAALLALRMAAGLLVARRVISLRLSAPDIALIPLRDLWGALVWAAGLVGSTVVWRDRRLRIGADGRIKEQPAVSVEASALRRL
ncbi:MAG: bacteriohopanetetrol glucosamine biosynthesis glycosyltransferase HpnI [Bryobacteraceae bacterium]